MARDVREGAHGDGNSKEGPTLVTDGRRKYNGNSNVWWPHALEKVTLYGTDMLVGAAADDAKRCHKQGINRRCRGTRQSCNVMGVEALGNATTNRTRGVQRKVEA